MGMQFHPGRSLFLQLADIASPVQHMRQWFGIWIPTLKFTVCLFTEMLLWDRYCILLVIIVMKYGRFFPRPRLEVGVTCYFYFTQASKDCRNLCDDEITFWTGLFLFLYVVANFCLEKYLSLKLSVSNKNVMQYSTNLQWQQQGINQLSLILSSWMLFAPSLLGQPFSSAELHTVFSCICKSKIISCKFQILLIFFHLFYCHIMYIQQLALKFHVCFFSSSFMLFS